MADVTKTIGSGGDFATWQDWADDINTNGNGYYTSGDTAIGQQTENLSSGTTTDIELKAPNGTNPIAKAIMEPSSGNAHNGVVGGGVKFTKTNGSGTLLYANDTVSYDVEIRDLEFYCSSVGGSWMASTLIRNGSNLAIEFVVKRCIIHAEVTAATNGTPYGVRDNYYKIVLSNCLIFDIGNTNTDVGYGAYNVGKIYNCAFYNCIGPGIRNSVTGGDVRNTIVLDCNDSASWDDYAGNEDAACDKNMASDTTAWGTTVYNSESSASIWTAPGSDDFTLQSGTNAIGNGETLGSTYEENVDITNVTRTGAWDLGPYIGDDNSSSSTAGMTTSSTVGMTTSSTVGMTTSSSSSHSSSSSSTSSTVAMTTSSSSSQSTLSSVSSVSSSSCSSVSSVSSSSCSSVSSVSSSSCSSVSSVSSVSSSSCSSVSSVSSSSCSSVSSKSTSSSTSSSSVSSSSQSSLSSLSTSNSSTSTKSSSSSLSSASTSTVTTSSCSSASSVSSSSCSSVSSSSVSSSSTSISIPTSSSSSSHSSSTQSSLSSSQSSLSTMSTSSTSSSSQSSLSTKSTSSQSSLSARSTSSQSCSSTSSVSTGSTSSQSATTSSSCSSSQSVLNTSSASSSSSGTDYATGTRRAQGTVTCSYESTIRNELDDGPIMYGSFSKLVANDALKHGIQTRKITRAWWSKPRALSSGNTEDIDLYDLASQDIGAGLGRDGLGQLLMFRQVTFWLCKQLSGAGRLEINATLPTNRATWVPQATVANGLALQSNGVIVFSQPIQSALLVVDASSHMVRFGANGGDIVYQLVMLGRHHGS